MCCLDVVVWVFLYLVWHVVVFWCFARALRFGDCALWFGWLLLLASVLIVVVCWVGFIVNSVVAGVVV